tara:strand:- start:25809 stop:26294 length:486 start_codon:yes stop_codon:yes gene_type:complete
MKYLKGAEERRASAYMEQAALIASAATCTRARCGSIIVKNNHVIGAGFNSPPGEFESHRYCDKEKQTYEEKITDKTCCIHAEQRAIMDALHTNPNELTGARIYFTRVDAHGHILKSGKPYCTICSKMSLDVGLAEFVLWHENGICVYDTQEYDQLSHEFSK